MTVRCASGWGAATLLRGQGVQPQPHGAQAKCGGGRKTWRRVRERKQARHEVLLVEVNEPRPKDAPASVVVAGAQPVRLATERKPRLPVLRESVRPSGHERGSK